MATPDGRPLADALAGANHCTDRDALGIDRAQVRTGTRTPAGSPQCPTGSKTRSSSCDNPGVPRKPDGSIDTFDDLPEAYKAHVNTSEAPYDRRPGDAPALNDAEIDDVIAFLRTLTDGWSPAPGARSISSRATTRRRPRS